MAKRAPRTDRAAISDAQPSGSAPDPEGAKIVDDMQEQLALLRDVACGHFFERASTKGGEEKGTVYPTLDQSLQAAAKLIDKLALNPKGRPILPNRPPVNSAKNIADALAELVRALAAGEITLEEATVLAHVLELRRNALETYELEARIAALEDGQENAAGNHAGISP